MRAAALIDGFTLGSRSCVADHLLMPVEVLRPDHSFLEKVTEVSATSHRLSIVQLDPSRPTVVSVAMSRKSAPSTTSTDTPPSTPPVTHSAEPPSAPSGTSVLMVSPVIKQTRRSSLHPSALQPAAVVTQQSPVDAEPASVPASVSHPSHLLVSVTDTLDKSEVHLLSDILSRGKRAVMLHADRRILHESCCHRSVERSARLHTAGAAIALEGPKRFDWHLISASKTATLCELAPA